MSTLGIKFTVLGPCSVCHYKIYHIVTVAHASEVSVQVYSYTCNAVQYFISFVNFIHEYNLF